MKQLSILLAIFALSGLGSLHAQMIEAGTWHGKVEFPGQSLRLVLHLEQTADGWTGTLDSPDQNAAGMVADSVSVNHDTLMFSIERLGVLYEGFAQLEDDVISINGTFSQAGFKLPLRLGKEALEGPKRPQTPVGPFPYLEEEVTFESPEAGIILSGTLTIPKEGGPFPAAVLITGSGPQDRNETIGGHQPFLIIADALSRQGIAVLRYDERGIGESEGKYSTATSLDFSKDAEAALEYLASREEVIPTKTGFIGHSEGGLIAPMIASRKDGVGFVVMLAGPSITGQEVIVGQSAFMLNQMGIPAPSVEKLSDVRKQVFEILRANPNDSIFIEQLRAQTPAIVTAFTASEKMMLGMDEATFADQFSTMATPWYRYFLDYDPYPALEATTCPILALNGDLDVQVLADPNLTKLEALFEEGGHPASKAVLLEGLNHMFQPAETGLPLEYSSIETTFDSATLELMIEWIQNLE